MNSMENLKNGLLLCKAAAHRWLNAVFTGDISTRDEALSFWTWIQNIVDHQARQHGFYDSASAIARLSI